MALYWNPFWQLDAIQRELDRVFDAKKTSSPISRSSFLPGRSARAYPLLNIYEDKDNIFIEALAPGVDPGTFDVTVVHNRLTISGQKNGTPDQSQPEAYHRSERAAGRFARTLELPVEVNDQAVKADYVNGLLHVTLPKAEQAKPRQISINVA